MKNLKKLLAVVLVAAMVLGVGALSASAAFTDTATSNYKTAIDVLSGIGVIDGTTPTTYEPNGSLTRAAAAKVITYMLLGPTNAALIKQASSQTFSDVPTSHWASGYIDYCASQGIIAGTGDGTFKPEDVLTTIAFTKMLLVALGYNADIEGYVGSNWAINIASDALAAGITDPNITLSATTTCTREQAAQLAFKTLTAKMVEYEGGTTITIGGNTITTGAVRREVVNNAAVETINDDNVMQFAERYFKKLTSEPATVNGLNGIYWLYGGNVISGFVSTISVLATRAAGATIADLTDPANPKYVGLKSDAAVDYYINNYKIKAVDAASPADAAYAIGDYIVVGSLANGILYRVTTAIAEGGAITPGTNVSSVIDPVKADGVAGVVVNFIDSNFNGKYDAISFVQRNVAKVLADAYTKTTGAVTKVTIPGVVNMATDVNNVSYPEGLVKGDVVLYYASSDGKTYVEKATAIADKMTSYSIFGYVIGGKTYALGALAGFNPDYDDAATEFNPLVGKSGYTYYVDTNNVVCYVDGPTGAANLANTLFVQNAVENDTVDGKTYQAKAVMMDGTTQAITVAMTKNNPAGALAPVNAIVNDAAAADDDGELGKNTFYTFTKNPNGSYNLTKVAAANQIAALTNMAGATVAANDTSYTLTGRTANFLKAVKAIGATWTGATVTATEAYIGTSSTVFMYYNDITKTFSTNTGIMNAQSYGAGGSIYVLLGENNLALAVLCFGGTTSASASAYDQIFVATGATVSTDAFGYPLYTYTVVKNGVADSSVTSYSELNLGGLYFVKDYDANGYIPTGKAYTAVGAGVGTEITSLDSVTYAHSVISITTTAPATASYILNSDCKIFAVENNVFAQISPEQAALIAYDAVNDKITLIETSATDSSISAIYIFVD